MKYLSLIIAVSKLVEPIMADFNKAVAEGKSNDETAIKVKKILEDVEAALMSIAGVL